MCDLMGLLVHSRSAAGGHSAAFLLFVTPPCGPRRCTSRCQHSRQVVYRSKHTALAMYSVRVPCTSWWLLPRFTRRNLEACTVCNRTVCTCIGIVVSRAVPAYQQRRLDLGMVGIRVLQKKSQQSEAVKRAVQAFLWCLEPAPLTRPLDQPLILHYQYIFTHASLLAWKQPLWGIHAK